MSFRRHFFADRRGSISVAFALSIAVFMTGIGVALDYARISSSQTSLQSALDAAILSAGKGALATGDAVDKEKMIAEIKANLPEYLQPLADKVQITQTAEKLTVEVKGSLNNSFGNFHGTRTSSIGAAASVELGTGARLEIALVLDTTGSMAEMGKMVEMKKAANALIDTLVANKKEGAEIAIGVVPFEVQVRINTSNAKEPWLTMRVIEAAKAENPWAPNWDGCITDRDQPFHRKRSVPNTNLEEEKYPAQICLSDSRALRPILPLTTNIYEVRSRIASLQPGGLTNTVVGLAWGLNILNPAAPLGGGAASTGSKPVRAIVFLTDGLNSQSRYAGSSALNWMINSDMRLLCQDAKSSDVRIFTVRVIDGDDALLRDCATDPVDFYPINNASELSIAFRAIGGKLKQLRLSR